MIDRKEKCKELIKNNPKLSGNKIYELSKTKGFGIKKSNFYKLIREIRDLPEPTQEKKEKSIPIKYKDFYDVIRKIPIPKKRGSYGIIEVDVGVDDDEKSFWIKYEDKKSLNKQIDKLKRRYKIKIKKIKFHGFGKYREFIDKEFVHLLESVGINV